MEIVNPHDKFFKETFSDRENVVDFVRGTFPDDLLECLDLPTLTLDNSGYVDEELKEYFSDVVYTCFSKEKELKIALLFEHKSYPVKYPHLQLLKYLLKIWETNIKQRSKLVPVIPLILYHGKDAWKVKNFTEYFKGVDKAFYRFIPEFEYLFIDLSKYSNAEIKNDLFKRVSLEMALLMMRNIFNEKELSDKLQDFFEIGRQYFKKEKGLKFLESVIRYLYSSTDLEVDKVANTIKEISEKGEVLVMTTAAMLIEKGKAEGKAEGKVEGEKALLIRLIERKWGKLQDNMRGRLDKINKLDELDLLGEKLISSDCVEDLFSD